MAGFSGIAGFGLKFKDYDLFAFDRTSGSSQDFGPFDGWLAYGNLVIIGNQQDFIQLDLVSLGFVQAVYIDRFTGNDFILFTTGFNYSVNGTPPITTTVYSSRKGSLYAIAGLRVRGVRVILRTP